VRTIPALAGLAAALCGCAAPRPSRDTLYQVSTLQALMAGDYDGVVTIRDLKRHGDLGLGTFDGLDGEMVVCDGRVWQVRDDGRAYAVPDTAATPFAAVTWFESDAAFSVDAPTMMEALIRRIEERLPARNLPYALRISGRFSYVKTRSVPRQSKPYPPLVEVARRQPTFEFHDVDGVVVGWRLPDFFRDLNMPGHHHHFLTGDRTAGGHVLAYTLVRGRVEADLTPDLYVTLPRRASFDALDLAADRSSEVKEVER